MMRPTTGGLLPAMSASLAWLVAVVAAAILWGWLTWSLAAVVVSLGLLTL
ncbi:hypothetical protein [Halomonas sp. LBP4]|nr:hypothetical protein [Halomonas sp. LBP4]